MAEARGRDNWAHTSAILALIANVNRDPKKGRPFKAADFDPYAAFDKKHGQGAAIEVTDMAVLKNTFVGKNQGRMVAP